jgi:hypothetical protein
LAGEWSFSFVSKAKPSLAVCFDKGRPGALCKESRGDCAKNPTIAAGVNRKTQAPGENPESVASRQQSAGRARRLSQYCRQPAASAI